MRAGVHEEEIDGVYHRHVTFSASNPMRSVCGYPRRMEWGVAGVKVPSRLVELLPDSFLGSLRSTDTVMRLMVTDQETKEEWMQEGRRPLKRKKADEEEEDETDIEEGDDETADEQDEDET